MVLKFNPRPFFFALHQWIGLAASLFVLVLCGTGTILAFQEPVEAWVNRGVLRVEPRGERLPLARVVAGLPADKPFTFVLVPSAPDAALRFRAGRAITYVDPYTGAVLGGVNQPVRDAFMAVFRLHRWLLLDDAVGRPITGVATLLFVVTLATGFALWLPRRLWKVRRATPHDLHVALGLYATPLLLVMGLTAFHWSASARFEQAVYHLVERRAPPAEAERPEPPRDRVRALPYAAILAAAERAFPGPGLVRIVFPGSLGAPVEVAKIRLATATSMATIDTLELDARTAAVRKVEPFADRSPAAKLLARVRDLHTGTILGNASLVLYVIACAVGTSLPLTGVLHWWGKLRARRRAAARRATLAAAG